MTVVQRVTALAERMADARWLVIVPDCPDGAAWCWRLGDVAEVARWLLDRAVADPPEWDVVVVVLDTV